MRLFFSIVYLLTYAVSFGQSKAYTLPFVANKGFIATKSALEVDSQYYREALVIYKRLVDARGDFRFQVPDFKMNRDESYVAVMDYDNMDITLEEKAYLTCKQFGDKAGAAIAFLLGHELTHYYEKHAWRTSFVDDFKNLAIGVKLDSIADDIAHETEADYLGGFLAYSAGYGTFDQGPEIIASLYKSYELPDDIEGYPTKSDRQEMNRRTTEKVKELVQVFEMANYLVAIGSYEEANNYYRFVLNHFQSRELYSNLGATTLMQAQELLPRTGLGFRYPFELDLQSVASRGGDEANAEKAAVLLRQAISYCDVAISLDPFYAPAYLNKACAYALLGIFTKARFYATEEAQAAANTGGFTKTSSDINVLLGIIEAGEGRTDAAEQYFQKAIDAGNSLAAFNLRVLRKETSKPSPKLATKETIDGQTMEKVESRIRIDPAKRIPITASVTFNKNPKQGENSLLLISQNEQPDRSLKTLFHVTGAGYKGATAQGIRIGSTHADIEKAYGPPQKSIETPRGRMLVYNLQVVDKGIIFILDEGEKLTSWINYSITQ